MKTSFSFPLAEPPGLACIDLIKVNLTDEPGKPKTEGYLVTRVVVPRAHRRKGIGKLLMKQLCREADKEQVPLLIQPLPYSERKGINAPMKTKDLAAWYYRSGFTKANEDGYMMRLPQKPKKESLI